MPPQHQEKPGLESKVKPRPRYEAPLYQGADKLVGKVALISGGDSGIGRAVAVLFAREGADVAIVYLPMEQTDAEETRQAVEKEGRRALLIPGDVRDSEFCDRAVQVTLENFDRLDLLVNNAAFQQHQEGLEDITDEQWDRTLQTNIYGYFYMTRAALPHLKEGSAIVNTRVDHRFKGQQRVARLLGHQGCDSCIHKIARAESGCTRNSRQLPQSWAGVDTTERIRQASKGSGEVRR